MDAKIKELKTESVQASYINKLRMTGKDMGRNTTALEDFFKNLWLYYHGCDHTLPEKATWGAHCVRKNAWC